MQMVAYRNTVANLKRIVPDQPEQINPRYLKGRDRLIAMSREYQRRQDERKAAEAAKQERIRDQVARDKAKWAACVETILVPVPDYENIVSMVACWHGFTAQDIYRSSRAVKLVTARHDAMAAVWLNCKLEGEQPTLLSMGRAFKRDHTTVLSALRKHGLQSVQKPWTNSGRAS